MGAILTTLKEESIFEQCNRSFRNIVGDFGGGSPVPKTFLMSYLTQAENLRSFLELGVYRGKSIFPVAYSVSLNGGQSVGVDAYDAQISLENDVTPAMKLRIQKFFQDLDMEEIYRDLLVYKEGCGFGHTIQIIRKTSDSFFASIEEENDEFDLVHIDANHDTFYVEKDYKNSLRHIKQGGFFVFDDIDWPSVDAVYQEAKQSNPVVFECENFGILLHENPSLRRDFKVEQIAKKLKSVYKQVSRLCQTEKNYTPTVSVGVLVFNQVETIEECLNSILDQQGHFELKIVVADDSSNDGTSVVVRNFISKHTTEKIKFEYIRNETNVGIMRNLELLSKHCRDSDYVTFIEGDDYYLSAHRISSHLMLHQRYPDVTMSFNGLLLLDETKTESKYRVWDGPQTLGALTTKDLLLENHVGNLGSMFFNSQVLEYLTGSYEKMFVGDWFHSILCSQYGSIFRLASPLNVYRKTGKGFWTSKTPASASEFLMTNLDSLNNYLDFVFDREISITKKVHAGPLRGKKPSSVAIVDDIFPYPGSGFRFEEFREILTLFPDSEIITTGESCYVLGNDGVEELLIDFKRSNPQWSNRVQLKSLVNTVETELLYCDFLGNAYHNLLPLAEASSTPFVFTLYPGGAFALDNKQSDKMLSRVLKSPHFRKVIVTQTITRDYLLQKKLCTPEKIEMIWGVVVPKESLELSVEKMSYGFEKSRLDLCFVAHQYTPTGSDKGFDTFLQMAKILSTKFENIFFHIVGPWKKEEHDFVGIKNLRFYGVLSQNELNEFYKDKDAIVSPNRPGQIVNGSFDGFPTASVTDASLRRVAMITTDPLSLNDEHFVDGKEIVIVPNDPKAIATKIEYFIHNPATLTSIANHGYTKSNFLYSVDRQSTKRVELIEEMLVQLKSERRENPSSTFLLETRRGEGIVWSLVRGLTPSVLKRVARKLMRLYARIRAV